jgi:hypothetical protein
VLEATLVVQVLRPFTSRRQTEIIAAPKVHGPSLPPHAGRDGIRVSGCGSRPDRRSGSVSASGLGSLGSPRSTARARSGKVQADAIVGEQAQPGELRRWEDDKRLLRSEDGTGEGGVHRLDAPVVRPRGEPADFATRPDQRRAGHGDASPPGDWIGRWAHNVTESRTRSPSLSASTQAHPPQSIGC